MRWSFCSRHDKVSLAIPAYWIWTCPWLILSPHNTQRKIQYYFKWSIRQWNGFYAAIYRKVIFHCLNFEIVLFQFLCLYYKFYKYCSFNISQMFCMECGMQLADGKAKFCGNCGTKVPSASKETDPGLYWELWFHWKTSNVLYINPWQW